MKSQATGEQAVTIGNVDDIVLAAAGCDNCASRAFRPYVNVVLGVSDNGLLSRCARRSVHTDKLAVGHREKTEGVIIAEVGFYRKGELGYVVNRLYIIGRNACFVQLLLIKRYVFISVLYHFLKALCLNRPHFVTGGTFYLRFEDSHCFHFLNQRLYPNSNAFSLTSTVF